MHICLGWKVMTALSFNPQDCSSFLMCCYLVLSAFGVGPRMTPQIANLHISHDTLVLENQISHSTNSACRLVQTLSLITLELLAPVLLTSSGNRCKVSITALLGAGLREAAGVLLYFFWRAEAPQHRIKS